MSLNAKSIPLEMQENEGGILSRLKKFHNA
jgi:hypothetical protein